MQNTVMFHVHVYFYLSASARLKWTGYLARAYSAWHFHFGIFRFKNNMSFCTTLVLSFLLHCWLYLTVLAVNSVENSHVRDQQSVFTALSCLSFRHFLIQKYFLVTCVSQELFCCDDSHVFVWLSSIIVQPKMWGGVQAEELLLKNIIQASMRVSKVWSFTRASLYFINRITAAWCIT